MNMDEKIIKIAVPGSPGEVYECTQSDLAAFAQCMKSHRDKGLLLNLMASAFIAVTYPFKDAGNIIMKRVGIGLSCCFIGSLLSQLYGLGCCMPTLQKACVRKQEESPEKVPDTHINEVKPSDYTPMTFNDLDTSNLSNFSLDSGFKFYSVDEEKEMSQVPEKKTVTYEELRKRNLEQNAFWSKNTLSKPWENETEKKDDYQSSSSRTLPRTNIYGDVLE